MVFITETEFVYCAVRTELVCKDRAMASPLVTSLSPRSFSFDPRSVSVSVVVDKVALSKVILRVNPLSPVSIIGPHSHPPTYLSHQKDERAKSGFFPKINVLSEI